MRRVLFLSLRAALLGCLVGGAATACGTTEGHGDAPTPGADTPSPTPAESDGMHGTGPGLGSAEPVAGGEHPDAAVATPNTSADAAGVDSTGSQAPERPSWWPAAAGAAPAGAWVESRAGYANRFAVAGPFTKRTYRQIRELAPLAQMLGELGVEWRVTSFAGPLWELAPFERLRKKDPIPFWLLRARVWSPRLQDVTLKTGATGKADLWLNGERAFATESDQYLLPDHHRIVATLDEGYNELAVRLEKVSPHAVQLSLRIRDLLGQPVEGLAWSLPDGVTGDAGRSLCDGLELALVQRATPDGWELSATARATGLLPPPAERVWALVIDGAAAPLAQAPFELATLARDELRLAGSLTATEEDTTVSLTIGETRCRSRTIRHRSALRRRLLASEADIGELATGLGEGSRDSLAFHAQRVRRLLEANDPRDGLLLEDVEGLDALTRTARTGKDPYEALTGVVTRAYRSEYDGSLQRYVMLVPPSYAARPKASFPLIVASHGLFYSPEDMVRIITGRPTRPGWALKHDTRQFSFPDSGALIVAHDGYGNAGHRPPGEVDVRRVIEEVTKAYRVDPRRVSLTGFSLGGSVGFWVPFHQPDLFAAAAPLCGYPNVEEYRRVRSVKKRPWEHVLLAHEGIVNYAEGGRYLPLRIVHGARDRPERSQLVVDRYRKLRYRVDFEVPKGMGHNVWDHAYEDGELVRWLSHQRRPATARAPRLRTARYRWNKSYWLRLDRFARWGEFAELAGRLRKGNRKLVVRTGNVQAFSILSSELDGERGGRRRLVVDGQDLGEVGLAADLFLARDDDARWRLTDLVDTPLDRKRPGLEGPLRDLWYEPFVIVYGTQHPLETEANRMTAEDARRYSPWIDAEVPVLADTEITPQELAGRHVMLVGNPRSNLLTRAAAQLGLPVTFDEDALVFAGQRYVGEDVGISTILPSPFDDDRYLVLHAGVGPEGTLSARFLPEWVPDYLIYDSRIRAQWWDYLLSRREVLAGGFYDEAWRP